MVRKWALRDRPARSRTSLGGCHGTRLCLHLADSLASLARPPPPSSHGAMLLSSQRVECLLQKGLGGTSKLRQRQAGVKRPAAFLAGICFIPKGQMRGAANRQERSKKVGWPAAESHRPCSCLPMCGGGPSLSTQLETVFPRITLSVALPQGLTFDLELLVGI